MAAADDPHAACDKLIAELTGGQHDDDVAALYVQLTGEHGQAATTALAADPAAVAEARAFVTRTLHAWDLDPLTEAATTIASELVTHHRPARPGPRPGCGCTTPTGG